MEKIRTGGGYNPNVGIQGADITNPFKSLFLKETQELELKVRGDLADFIQKQGTPFGGFNAANFPGYRSCKSAPYVTKEFTFQEMLRKGGTIHFYDRAIGPAPYGERCASIRGNGSIFAKI